MTRGPKLLSLSGKRVSSLLQVRSISPDPSGQWLASGSADATVKVWEVATGRCMRTWELSAGVKCVAWCPNQALCLLAAVIEDRVLLLSPGESHLRTAEFVLQRFPDAKRTPKMLPQESSQLLRSELLPEAV